MHGQQKKGKYNINTPSRRPAYNTSSWGNRGWRSERDCGDGGGFHPAPPRVKVLAQPRPFQCVSNILTNALCLGDMHFSPFHILLLESDEAEITKGSDFAMSISSLREEVLRPYAESGSRRVIPLVELHVRHVPETPRLVSL